jgi:hypothetical protein
MSMSVRSRARRSVVVASLLALSLAAAVQAQGPRQDGRWEVKIEIDLPGLAAMPPQTQTTCITPEDAANPQKAMLPGGPADPANCKISDYKAAGSKVTYSLKCEGQVSLSGTGDFTYMGNTYTGTFKADMAGQMLTIRYSGQRLGDCKD